MVRFCFDFKGVLLTLTSTFIELDLDFGLWYKSDFKKFMPNHYRFLPYYSLYVLLLILYKYLLLTDYLKKDIV